MTHLHNRTTSRPKRFVAIAAAALMASTAAGTAFAQQTPSPSQPSAAAASDSRDGSTMRRGDGPRMSGQRGERGGKNFKGHGGRGGMQGMERMGGGGRHAGMMARMFTPARVADALSTIETGIGVRPDQMEAWRTFTAAVVAFADASQPPRMGMGMGQGRGMMMPNAGTDTSDADTAMADDTDTAEETDDTAASDAVMEDESDDSTSTAGQAAPQFRAFRMLDRMADRAIAKAGDAEALKSAIAEVEGVLTPEQITAAHGIVRSMMRDAHAERRMEMRGHGGGRGDMRRGHGHGHGGGSEGGYHHRGGDDGRGPDRR
ncbi:hypothetical protein [Aurantimonas marianensis]|uniref:LTXXQ motif family protein n=1 Tax=Aurantimonas marianensis TaxID=2920428 RepID=A0A9X2H5L4_9HYPH|nr:hypothetical protein [Aurantimonas marianensis]MCP3056055.1 hypothetical protein [Aurantimonas marianensis]